MVDIPTIINPVSNPVGGVTHLPIFGGNLGVRATAPDQITGLIGDADFTDAAKLSLTGALIDHAVNQVSGGQNLVATGSARPTHTTSQFGDLPGAVFNGTANFMAWTGLDWDTNEVTIAYTFIPKRLTSGSGEYHMDIASTPSRLVWVIERGKGWWASFDSTTTDTLAEYKNATEVHWVDRPHLVIVRVKNGVLEVFFDGNVNFTHPDIKDERPDVDINLSSANVFTVGSHQAGSTGFTEGVFGQICVWGRFLKNSEIKGLTKHMVNRFGVTAPPRTIKTLLWEGEGGSIGKGLVSNLASEYTGLLPNTAISRKTGTPEFTPMKVGDTNFNPHNDATMHGADCVFMKEYVDATDDDIAIIKYATDDTSLASDWLPGETDGATLTSAKANRVAHINHMRDTLGYTPEILGVCWHQGETDATDATDAGNYATNLAALIADTREHLGIPDLPYYLIMVDDDDSGTYTHTSTVQAAILAVAAADDNVYVIDERPYGWKDTIHVDSETLVWIGNSLSYAITGVDSENYYPTAPWIATYNKLYQAFAHYDHLSKAQIDGLSDLTSADTRIETYYDSTDSGAYTLDGSGNVTVIANKGRGVDAAVQGTSYAKIAAAHTNSLDGFDFRHDGTNGSYYNADMTLTSGDMTLIVYFHQDAQVSSTDHVIDSWTAQSERMSVSVAPAAALGKFMTYSGAPVGTSQDFLGKCLFMGRGKNGVQEIFLNVNTVSDGTPDGSATTADDHTIANTDATILGGRFTYVTPFDGKIFEFIAIDGFIDDATADLIQEYFIEKYSIPA